MENERSASWLRRVYPHNPLYLVSAALALYGVGVAMKGAPPERFTLITPLMCGYVVLMVVAGWLVVHVGKVWEDARTLLLTVLLVFVALSTAYDKLCLDDATAGGRQLGVAFVFCCVTVESALAALRIRLPIAYRAPFYLQLAVLFAFPAPLGQHSIDGNDPAMCLGVLGFSVASGLALLALLPAVAARSLQGEENGTPWPWPYYPWSIFVFMAIAMAVRSWLLSVSFSPSRGVDPSFLPYFLAPIVLAVAVLLLEIGLRHDSRVTQRVAAVLLGGVVLLSFPGADLNRPQALTVGLLESRLAGPPLVACGAVVVVALYAALRRSALAEPVLLATLWYAGAAEADTRSISDLSVPAGWSLAAISLWLAARGFWSRNVWRLGAAMFPLLLLVGRQPDWSWLLDNNGLGATAAGLLGVLAIPLFAGDAWSRWVRRYAPAWFLLASPAAAIAAPPWWELPEWSGFLAPAGFALVTIAYWARERLRWHLVSVAWSSAVAVVAAATTSLQGIGDAQLQRGLAAYAAGCVLLLVGLAVSLCEAGVAMQAVDWLLGDEPAESDGEPV